MSKTTGKMALEYAERLAKQVVAALAPFCEKIEVAGSIRRRRPRVNDIDIILIPKDPWGLHAQILKLSDGGMKMSGGKISRMRYLSTDIDIYFATPETWATLLLIRTGSAENNIRLCSRAKDLGWHLHANGDGLFNEKGQRIAGNSELSIYNALGLPWQRPEERG